jgi:hypothetical protein
MRKPNGRRTARRWWLFLPKSATATLRYRIAGQKRQSAERRVGYFLFVPRGRLIGAAQDARIEAEAGLWIDAIAGLAICRTRDRRRCRHRFRLSLPPEQLRIVWRPGAPKSRSAGLSRASGRTHTNSHVRGDT